MYTGRIDSDTISCPGCGRKMDGFSHKKKMAPEEEDLSVCCYCAQINVYKKNSGELTLVEASQEVVEEIKNNPGLYRDVLETIKIIKLNSIRNN